MKILVINDVHPAWTADTVLVVAAARELSVAEAGGEWTIILGGDRDVIFASRFEGATRDVMHALVGAISSINRWQHAATWHIRMSRIIEDTFGVAKLIAV